MPHSRTLETLEPIESEPSSGENHDVPFPELSPAAEQRLTSMLGMHFASVWRLGRRMGLSNEIAEETAQESFLVAARKLEFIAPGRERAYLFGVLLRLAANARRTAAARHEFLAFDPSNKEMVDPRPDVDLLFAQKQQRALLDRILDSMPEAFREVLVLFEIEDCSLAEMAEALRIPEGTVASRLRRAREEFARRVQRLRATLAHDKEAL